MIRAALVTVALACAGLARAHPEIEASLARLNTRIAAAPDNADLYLERGELYARHEEWLTAEANYLRASELSPSHPRLARARGSLELRTGHPHEALNFLNAALTRDARDAEALILRARANIALNARAAAIADFDSALALVATPPPELILERISLLSPIEALRSLDAALVRLGPVISLELRAIALEESIGRVDAALIRIARIAEQSERKETWLKRRGDLLARNGRTQEARVAYSSALAEIASLPDWLRASPETERLVTELTHLTASQS